MMPPVNPILSIRDAHFGYHTRSGRQALLFGINLEVGRYELIGLIGRNGSGKSTLLRTLMRIQELLKGEIYFDGKNIDDFHRHEFARIAAFVSTGVLEVEGMTIRELVSLGRFPYTNWIGRLKADDHEIIDRSLDEVGITSLADRKLNEVSDGERQKAMIARTLAQNSSIIILDEPTAFLDLPSKYDIINLLHHLTEEGKIIIYSSHDLNISLKFSDRLWVIDQGRILDGAPEDLILNDTFARIFESDKIMFNPLNGDFELKRNPEKVITLTGNDPVCLNWTMNALIRNGYRISDSGSSIPVVQVKKEKHGIIWILQTDKQNLLFESIYQMLVILDDLL